MVAEGNDALMEEFFDKGTLPAEHIVDGLDERSREMRLFPGAVLPRRCIISAQT